MPRFVSFIKLAPKTVFGWHLRFGAHGRLTPPWEKARLLREEGKADEGRKRFSKIGFCRLEHDWVDRFADYAPDSTFTTELVKGPLPQLRHIRTFDGEDNGTVLTDELHYRLPGHVFGQILFGRYFKHRLARMFRFRHRRAGYDLAHLEQYKSKAPLKIAVSGASGDIGQALVPFLNTCGHEVWRLVRRKPYPNTREIAWNPETGEIDEKKLAEMDAVIHLAGLNVGEEAWSSERKVRLLENRKAGAELLSDTLARLRKGPETLIVASATGYYGHQPGKVLDEDALPGNGFAPLLCQAIEESTASAHKVGIRVVHARLGVVLSYRGHFMKKLLPGYKCGFGAMLGDGYQYLSWVTQDDVLYALHHILHTRSLKGAVNITAPLPVTNRDFSDSLARVLNRPRFFSIPARLVRWLFGQMGDELMLADACVVPDKLRDSGFRHTFPMLDGALRWTLGKLPPLSQER